MDFYTEIITLLKEQDLKEKKLTKLKRELAQKYRLKSIPTNVEILLHIPTSEIPILKKKLLTKPTRTISGVSPVALMTKPFPCPHGKCIFCPGGIGSPWGDVPQSYTGHEPATMRAMRNQFDPYLTVFNRLEQYVILGHNFDKIELIIMSGTFLSMPDDYQEEFITYSFKALNDFSTLFFENGQFDYTKFKTFFELPGDIHDQKRIDSIHQKLLKLKTKRKSKNEKSRNKSKGKSKKKSKISLEEEQLKNETANIRCVALCVETRPDYGFLEQGNALLRQGCTRVELGIQSVYDDVLDYVNRGHTTAAAKKSSQILRDLGFKINFHYMPGLPLTDRKRDIAGMKKLFEDPDYRPDMIKFYPCMVASGTELFTLYKKGEFIPISTKEAAERIAEIKKVIPEYCRIQRIQRDVPTKYWEAGVDLTNLRQYITQNYDIKCRCIRCREPQGKKIDWKSVYIKVLEYEASQGKEYFLSVEDKKNDLLIGFCRLRFPGQFLRPEITPGSALIRELHVYGTATAIGEEGSEEGVVQHRGWGKKLIRMAEEIAKKKGKNKMVVISGIGVKEYYRKLGYEKEGPYMTKALG